MLSIEQRSNLNAYAYKGGLRNTATLIGWVKSVTPRGGILVQTKNGNHGLPFELGAHDRMPKNIREGGVIKIRGRVEGRRDPETGEPTTVFRVLFFDAPRVIELPPERVWNVAKPDAAPDAGVEPKLGQFGIKLDHGDSKYNNVDVAGYVSAVRLRKAGAVREDGKQTNGCLYLLVQQSADPNTAIPVRIYGKFVNVEERSIKIGSPVSIRKGSLRADVKPKKPAEVPSESEQPEVSEVDTSYYVKAAALYAVQPEDFADKELPERFPEWVIAMRASNEQSRRERIKERAQAAAESTDPVAGGESAPEAKGGAGEEQPSSGSTASGEPETAEPDGKSVLSEAALMKMVKGRKAADSTIQHD